ncbi:hypothetical protein BTO07_16045 [Polaribacter sp. SA4-12]|nr:hypothetical protein BTO07_16045 [Polaribacter sp. SA4-12]
MDNIGLLKKLSFNVSFVEHCRLGEEWDYSNIISPFTRLYLITNGEAYIYLKDQKIKLRKGYLYLIPSFQQCSYKCNDFMEQYYTTFTIRLPNKLSIYQLYNFNIEVKASSFHYELFKKLCSANPNMSLPSGNPLEYQKMNLNAFKNKQNGSKENLISSGIISLLLSEFINSTKMELKTESMNKIPESILFIHQNLSNRLNISELSAKYSMSSDHYTRKFKELTKQNPIDYINRQRIEKALLLLNTTSYSCKEIGYQCGFNSNTYFSKMFKKYVKFSPNDYRASLDNL